MTDSLYSVYSRVKDVDLPAIELVIRVKWRPVIAASAKDDHVSIGDGCGRMEVAPRRRCAAGKRHERPRQSPETKSMNIVGESILFFFVATEDKHGVFNHAGGMSISRAG